MFILHLIYVSYFIVQAGRIHVKRLSLFEADGGVKAAGVEPTPQFETGLVCGME